MSAFVMAILVALLIETVGKLFVLADDDEPPKRTRGIIALDVATNVLLLTWGIAVLGAPK